MSSTPDILIVISQNLNLNISLENILMKRSPSMKQKYIVHTSGTNCGMVFFAKCKSNAQALERHLVVRKRLITKLGPNYSGCLCPSFVFLRLTVWRTSGNISGDMLRKLLKLPRVSFAGPRSADSRARGPGFGYPIRPHTFISFSFR